MYGTVDLRNVKIVGSLLATNDRLNTRSGSNPTCNACMTERETQRHIMAECNHEQIVEARTRMIARIRSVIEENLHDKMSTNCWEILTRIWTENSLLRTIHRNKENEHAEYQWDDILGDTALGKLMTTHMQKITEPGATAMWHGWFTSHWSTAIVDIIKQSNPAIKEDKARRIAKKTAKALRNTIMDGQHDIWKIRNQVKHGTTEDGKMARETIEMLIEERAQYKIDTPMTATGVAKWTKAKQNKWKNKTEEKIAKAQKAKERLSRLQATWVSYGFTFEQRTTREDSNNTRTTRNTATQETKLHTDDSDDKQSQKTRPQADNTRDQDTTNSNKRKAQPNDGSRGKKTKYGNIDTVQHEKQKRHTRKRKRTPTEEGSIGNSEEDQNNTGDRNNKEEDSAEGKRKHKRKKPKNKRARYQQISDSSDSSDMNDDSDNDSMNDQTREEQAENRKGVG